MEMATERVAALDELWEAARRDLLNVEDTQIAGEAEPPATVMVPFLIDSRRKLKMLSRQLCVFDYIVILLESLESPDELLSNPCPKDADDVAYVQWKALKSQYRDGMQHVQDCIVSLEERLEQANEKRNMISQLLSALDRKRETSVKLQELERALAASQEALRLTQQRIGNLTARITSCHALLDNWVRQKDRLQWSVRTPLGLTGYKLQLVGDNQLRLELSPQTCQPTLGHVAPLSVSLTWNADDTFSLEMSQSAVGLLPESLHGPITTVSTALLQLMQCYLSQGSMLAEIQKLHSRFAIDWQPAQQQLIFLKSAAVMCRFHVDAGYPSTGSITLLSARGEKGPVSIESLQPPQESPTLTEWLEYLTTCPHI